MEVRAPGLCVKRDRCVLKNVICQLVHQWQRLSAFGPHRHSCGAKYDTELDQVKYFILPASLSLSLFYAHAQPHIHMHVTHAEMTYGPLRLWPHCPTWLMQLHLEGLRNECCFCEMAITAGPFQYPFQWFDFFYVMASHECWCWKEWFQDNDADFLARSSSIWRTFL